jgi:Kef-type K+ transport system membrane component KefB
VGQRASEEADRRAAPSGIDELDLDAHPEDLNRTGECLERHGIGGTCGSANFPVPVEELSRTLVTLGGIFLLGLATDALGRRTGLPRVTLLLVLGFAIGPSGLGWIPDFERHWFPLTAHVALAMVGFLLGNALSLNRLREHGRAVLSISVCAVVTTGLLVGAGLWLVGLPLELALVLGGISTATAPAASQDVVHEAGARGPFSDTLLGIVAVDDAMALILFSVLLVAAQAAAGDVVALGGLRAPLWDVGGAVLLGAVLGFPMAWLTGRVRPGEPTLAEALGAVFLCSGLALMLEVSYLLACVTLGTVVANTARHHERPFHAIEGVEWPLLILFFVLAGASLDVTALPALGGAGLAYVLLRAAGRVAGAWIGSRAARAPRSVERWMGLALMPQAGVALGMALVAAQRLPELAALVLPMVIATTTFFELVGPVLTRLALRRAGEA